MVPLTEETEVADADRQVEAYRRQKNLSAFLRMIRACEGTDAPNGYRYLFGSKYRKEKLFASFAAHPNFKQPFTQTDGTTEYTTAAGAYQFIYPTWSAVQTRLSLPDFSPESQDKGAIELIRQRGMLRVVEDGDVEKAIDVLWVEWASLPASKYPQPYRSLDFACNAFCDAGGVLA